jgi:ABC-type polysaccharide/polyol phosphate transport system ATPase subunit
VTTNNPPLALATPPAIRIEGLSKLYRLYQKPVYRLLDLFGLCPATPAYYTEHAALKDVNLAIGRGEKLAIIGRNGAGKSTLLKTITGLVRPTSGTIDVDGQVSNLLQIGSGFHPDFTGRQNVYSSLAHQGITGAAAARLFEEILAFAEIHEYIDQPMKTYSTGMCSRLMFSSSIVVKPDILIVDEILGVGDAYFSHKSFERMRDLCTNDGVTLLLVTHDIYGALNLCDRFIWIDRGEVKFDGDGKAAVSMYESSVKDQEEQALRQRNATTMTLTPQAEPSLVHVLFRSRTGFAPDRPVALGTIELVLDNGERRSMQVAEGAAYWSLAPEGNLSGPEKVAGQSCRVLKTAGSIFHKAEWIAALPAGATVGGLKVRYFYDGADAIDVRVFSTNRQLLVGGELPAVAGWTERAFTGNATANRELEVPKQTDFGTGAVFINRVQFIDHDGVEVVEVRHGDSFTVRLSLRVAPQLVNRDVTFIMGFARHESPYSAYVYEPRLTLPAGDECVVEMQMDAVQLGSGPWYVTMGIGEVGLYEREVVKYFTVDAAWYHMLASRLELRVTSKTKVDTFGCFCIHPAKVTVLTQESLAAAEGTHSR